MRKQGTILLLSILPFGGSMCAQHLFAEKLDSIVSPTEKHAYAYDEEGNTTLHNRFVREGHAWVLDDVYLYQYEEGTVHSTYTKRDALSGEMQWQYSEDLTTYEQGNWLVLTAPYYRYITSMDNEKRQLTSIMMNPGVDGEWKEVQKEIKTFDAEGRTLLTETYRMQGDVWVGVSRIQTSYSDEGLPTEMLTFEWQDGVWMTTGESVSTYNAKGQRVRYATYKYVQGNRVLLNETETTCEGDFVTRQVQRDYDCVDGVPVVAQILETLYDEHHNMELYDSKLRFANHYDLDGQLSYVLCYVCQEGEWVLAGKAEFAYLEDGTTEMLVRQAEHDGLEAATDDGLQAATDAVKLSAKMKLVVKLNEQGRIGKMWFYDYDAHDDAFRLGCECEPCYYDDALADEKLRLYWDLRSFLLTDGNPSDLLGNSGRCVRYDKVDGVNRVSTYRENWREANVYGGITTTTASMQYDATTGTYKGNGQVVRKTHGTNARMQVMTDVDERWDGEKWVLNDALVTSEATPGFSPLRQTHKWVADGVEQAEEYVFRYDLDSDVSQICGSNVLGELKCTSIDHYDGAGQHVDSTVYFYSPFDETTSVPSVGADIGTSLGDDGSTSVSVYDVTGRLLPRQQRGLNIVRKGKVVRVYRALR